MQAHEAAFNAFFQHIACLGTAAVLQKLSVR